MDGNYERYAQYWQFVEDVYTGNAAIKAPCKRERYLPRHQSEIGRDTEYLLRVHMTHFENLFRPLIDSNVGVMQKCLASVRFGVESNDESPVEVQDLDVYGNAQNDGLSGLKRRLNFQQALFGRAGLLLGIDNNRNTNTSTFVIREYPAEKILSGEHGKWYLLDESTDVFDGQKKTWSTETRWRLLALDSRGRYYTVPFVGDYPDVSEAWENFDILTPTSEVVYPTFHGTFLDVIPFTVCNAKTIGFDNWEMPPYYDIAQSSIDAYNADSFYRRAIANHATPTAVFKNAEQPRGPDGNPIPLAMGGVLWLKSSNDHPSDASILQASSDGLNAMKVAKDDIIEGLKRVMLAALLDGAGANSSGDAIQLRMMSGTATIADMDKAGAKAIEEQLCFAAYWAGASWAEVGDRISYAADTSYVKSNVSLSEAVQFLLFNATNRKVSNWSEYEILRTIFPTIPSWEDNQRMLQDEMANAI